VNKDELLRQLEETLQGLPERMSGNEASDIVTDWLRPLAFTNRRVVIETMRDLISHRVPPSEFGPEYAIPESRMWVALHVAEALNLQELRPDVESLLEDTRAGKTLLPVYEKSIMRYLKTLSK